MGTLKILKGVKELEISLGRKRNRDRRFGPRIVDIDILLYGREVIKKSNLTIPHPKMHERKFVLIPLLELDPYLRDPANGQLYWKYLLKIKAQGVYFHSFSRYT